MSLRDALQKTRTRKAAVGGDLNAMLTQAAEGAALEWMEKHQDDLYEHIKNAVAKVLPAQLPAAVDKLLTAYLHKRFKGDKGDSVVGPRGPQGLKGDTIVGPRGPKGEQGDSVVGPRGESIVGPPGPPGKAADARTVITLIKTLPEKEKLTIRDIRGLEKMLNAAAKPVRASAGGGMGNTQHESTSISSATTTVATTQKIAANGYALWVYYQGQLLSRGVQYTVGGDRKTLTLTFTPDDSTVIDVIYIRG